MRLLTAAQFQTDLPDDQVEEGDQIVVFAGKGVSEAVAELLRDAGLEVSAPEHQGERGWDFVVKHEGSQIWVQVCDVGDVYILVSEVLGPIARMLPASKRSHAQVLSKIAETMTGDPRFHHLSWYRPEDLVAEHPGAATPVAETI